MDQVLNRIKKLYMKKKYILIAALLVGSANLFANTVVIDNGIAIENVLENISVKVKVTNN